MIVKLDKEKVLKQIKACKPGFEKKYGVTKIGIFGSLARGTSQPGSDVDVVIEMKTPDLFYMVHVKQDLEEALGCPVDIVHYREKMNRFLKERIQHEAVYV